MMPFLFGFTIAAFVLAAIASAKVKKLTEEVERLKAIVEERPQ